MKVSGIQVKACNSVNFGTISEVDKKRSVHEGFKEKELEQAEEKNMPHFDLYYTTNGYLKSRKNALELTNRSAVSRYNALKEGGFFDEIITPDDLQDTLYWLRCIEDDELGILLPQSSVANIDFDIDADAKIPSDDKLWRLDYDV